MNCNVVQDLLPLYTDGACSTESRELVEEHLQECPACSEMLRKLKKTEIESSLQSEKESVIRYGERRFKRRSTLVGTVISGIFMIPILVCLIINFTSRRPMGWFFVMLASLCVAASLVIVPLMVPEDKLFWTFCSFCASLIVLLAAACLYTHGNWFWIASSATLFGLAVVFLPFVVKARPVRKLIGNSSRLLIVLGLDAALFVNMMNMISFHGQLTMKSFLYILGVLSGIGIVIFEILRKRGVVK